VILAALDSLVQLVQQARRDQPVSQGIKVSKDHLARKGNGEQLDKVVILEPRDRPVV